MSSRKAPGRPRRHATGCDGQHTSECCIPDCGRGYYARGWCPLHYSRWKSNGDPLVVGDPHANRRRRDVSERFWSKVTLAESGCWEWIATTVRGYGEFTYSPTRKNRQVFYAHRWAYEQMVAEIPEGLTIDHLCRNPLCVNPYHLEPVPNRVNVLRSDSPSAINARKTHCIHGHEFTEANTYIRKDTGTRQCRTCGRDRYIGKKAA